MNSTIKRDDMIAQVHADARRTRSMSVFAMRVAAPDSSIILPNIVPKPTRRL